MDRHWSTHWQPDHRYQHDDNAYRVTIFGWLGQDKQVKKIGCSVTYAKHCKPHLTVMPHNYYRWHAAILQGVKLVQNKSTIVRY
jgi:hypothetical protein